MTDEELKKIVDLTQKKVKHIDTTETNTIIHFENGESLHLNGGHSFLKSMVKEPTCSYCGDVRRKGNPMISPDNNPNILICSKCTVEALQMFVKSGLEIELDLSWMVKEKK